MTNNTNTDIGLNELPAGWKWVKLGDVCEIVTGNTPKRADSSFYGGNTPWVKPSDLDKELHVSVSDEYLSDAGIAKARLIPKGSVLVSCIGNLGKLAIAGVPLCTNQQINALIPRQDIDPRFLFYGAQMIKPQMERLASKTTLKIVNKTAFSSIIISLPPLEEQKRITAILNEQMVSVGKAKKAAEERLEAAQNLVFSLIYESLDNENILRVELASCLKEIARGVGTDWSKYELYSVTKNGLGMSTYEVGKNAEKYKLLTTGTIFYSMRINIGSIALVEEGVPDGIGSPDAVVFRCIDKLLHWRWFYYWMRSSYGKALVKGNLTGSVRARFKFNDFIANQISIPDWDTQQKTAVKIKATNDLIEVMRSELDAIEAMPASLLRKAFKGEL